MFLGQDVPASFTGVAFPVEPSSMASALFVAGGVILIAVAGLTLGFALLRVMLRRTLGGMVHDAPAMPRWQRFEEAKSARDYRLGR